jgi:glucose-6-phosphate dehydrogenase assembly protein OpcA
MPSKKAQVEARIATFCHLAGPRRQVCCEQIIIRAVGRAVQSLPGVMTPLFLPDLPTVLWWNAPRALPALPRRLFSMFDCLVVDSARWQQPDLDLQRAATVVTRPARRPRLLDLAWIRTAPWREAIAELFDAPDALAQLPRVSSVSIEAARRGSALLLAGWLQSRLPALPDPLIADTPEAAAVEISACRLETDSDPPARFCVEHDTGLTWTTTLPGRPERQARLLYPHLECSTALCGVLETMEGDPLLEQALQALA